MPVHDLREYIEKIEELGLLKRIKAKVDWNLEIAGLSDMYRRRKSVLFDNVKGYPKGYRVMTNIITTEEQVKLLVGAPLELSTMELVKYLKAKLSQFRRTPPHVVKTGPILENVLTGDKVDLLRFPVLKFHELDGGRYIGTQDNIITREPDEGWVNLGTYRVMVHNKNTAVPYMVPGRHGALMREKHWSRGQSCPVAVVCGGDPILMIPSTTSFPWGVSEYEYAGYLSGEPIEVVEAPVTGLPIPATAEIVIEGEMPPPEVEKRMEGPFGEWTGYYGSGAAEEPVIRVKSILFRNNPILGAQSAGHVPSEIRMNPVRSAILWEQLEKSGVPEIRGVWRVESGSSFFINAISIKQRYAGHARHAGLAAAGCRQGADANRLTIVVDDDIDPTNEDDVWWAVASRCDPATDIETIRGTWDSRLNPRLEPDKRKVGDFTASQAIIYAVRPFHWMKDFPPVCKHSQEYLEGLVAKFKDELSDISKEELRRLVSAKVYR